MNTLLNKGGIIVNDTDLEGHWVLEFENGLRLTMFDTSGCRHRFDEAIKVRSDFTTCFWNPVYGRMPQFGIIKRENQYFFFVGRFAFYPNDFGFMGSIIHEPRLFIRNFIKAKIGSQSDSGFDHTGRIEYHAAIKYLVGTELKEVGLAWNGSGFVNIGFNNIIHVGEVEVK